MKWRAKVISFKILSMMPGGERFYRFAQEHITRSLDPTPERLGQKIDIAFSYLDWLSARGESDRLLKGTHLDFGSGWHPTIPLTYYCLGVPRQHLFDIGPVMDASLLNATAKVFKTVINQAKGASRFPICRLPPPTPATKAGFLAHLDTLGMTYSAPYSKAVASLEGAIDVVTSTQVLLHVPPEHFGSCMRQVFSMLKPGGLFFGTVYLRDILTGAVNNNKTSFHQLRYSPEVWSRWFSSSIMSFNRFKAPDYRGHLEKAGFSIEHFEVEPGSPEDMELLDKTDVADCFRHFSREDLAARHLYFVARKP